MVYYKVITGDKHDYKTGYTTIKNELVTPRERKMKFSNLPDKYFNIVNVSQKNIYFFFGARFENDNK